MMRHADGLTAAPVLIQDAIVQAILQRGLVDTFYTLTERVLEWCRMIVELPHHKGGLGITPSQASGMAAFYSATAELVAWLHSFPHASEWAAGQNLADPDTWTSSALRTPKQLHDQLLMHYNCTEWGPPPDADAHAPNAPAQERDDDNARPLSLPPLNLLASLRGRQDVENGSCCCSPVATSATSGHTAHQGRAHDPPNERMRDVHKLHHIQSVPTDWILRRPARRFFSKGRARFGRGDGRKQRWDVGVSGVAYF
jgi:hypothetical protein